MNAKEKRIDRKILRILIPAILENALLMLSNTILTAYIGRMTVEEISSYGIVNRIFSVYFALFKGFAIGAMILMARSFGKGDRRECARDQEINYTIVIPLAVVSALFIYFKPEVLLGLITKDAEMMQTGCQYLRLTAPIYPVIAAVHLNSSAFQANGNTRTPLLIAAVGNIFNIAIGYVLIFGFGPIKALGLIGAGWAQNCSYAVMYLAGLYLLYGKNGLFECRYHVVIPSSNEVKQLFAAGLPAAIENSFWSLAAVYISSIILTYGENYYAAYQFGLQGEGFCDMMSAGFLTAAMSLSSNAVGARDDEMYRSSYQRLSYFCLIISLITMLFLLLCSKSVLGLMTDKPELVNIANGYLAFMIFSQYPQHKQKIVFGYIRAAGHNQMPMIINFIGIWLVRVVLVYLFGSVMHLSILLIWVAFDIDQWVREILAEVYFKKKRIRNYIGEQIHEKTRTVSI